MVHGFEEYVEVHDRDEEESGEEHEESFGVGVLGGFGGPDALHAVHSDLLCDQAGTKTGPE